MRILIVEDDHLVAQGLKEGLQQLGYTCDVAHSAEEAEVCICDEEFDIALVDISLPKADGLSFIRQLRSRSNPLPALVLTASGSMDDTVRGLDAGADDYMIKPYRLPEVAARIRALIRRSNAIADACLCHDGVCLDTRSHTATLNGAELDLTNREWAILEMLLMASPAVVSKDKLVQRLAGWDKDITPNAIEVHLSRLRQKLSSGSIVIRTVRGIGYRVDAPNN
ncbi:MAG: response regulator transcription factor [Dechloromonas sp.]|nr:response regulator transcription factor [Dechloromonas sp.]